MLIDYVNGIRECNICHKVKSFVDFGVQKKKYPRAYCKACQSKQSYNHHQEKKLTLYPDNYNQCDDCCHIFRKASFQECPKCEKLKKGTND